MNDNLKKIQVYKHLRRQILDGDLVAGQKLDGETRLAAALEVSRITLREALDMLSAEKLIDRVERKGNFVSRNPDRGSYLAICAQQSDMSNPFNYIIPGIEKRLAKAGRRLNFCSNAFFRALAPDTAREMMQKNSVRGIFLLEGNFNGGEPEVELIRALDLPVIAPHAAIEDRRFFDCPLMLFDMRRAFADGVRFLASLGHVRIGSLGLRFDSEVSWRGYSLDEYRDFLRCNRLDDSPELCVATSRDEKEIRRAVRTMMLGPKAPTAIMCFSDFFAIHVYEELRALKLQIPEQVSVMGFCGYPGGQFMDPPLSTVDLQYEKIGIDAAERMLNADDWFRTPEQAATLFLPYRLIERESTVAPYLVSCQAKG